MANTPTVKHIAECLIKPKSHVEEAKKPIYLNPLDLSMLSARYIQKGLLHNKPSSMNNLLDNLKDSLSVALIHFYPLSGRLDSQIDEDQHTMLVFINCNKSPGARFIHATLDMKISEILSPKDVPHVVQLFFDHDRAVNHDGHVRPLLSIQVTELVDGVFIGISMNHACGDGTSYWNLFNTLCDIFMAKGESSNIVLSRPPIHKRWFLESTGPIIKLPFTNPDEFIERYEAPKLRERIFHFSSESIAQLKARANEERGEAHKKISSFQSLSALVWRCITRARRLPDNSQTTCFLSINVRRRLCPPLSENCFGNIIQIIHGETKAGELLSQNLALAAVKLHQAVEEHTNEKVRNGVKAWMDSPFVYRFGSYFDPQSVHMGSSPRFNMYGNEFGMGKPLAVLSGYANKFDGKVTSYPDCEGGGSIDLEICLAPDTMCALESDAEFMEVVFEAC